MKLYRGPKSFFVPNVKQSPSSPENTYFIFGDFRSSENIEFIDFNNQVKLKHLNTKKILKKQTKVKKPSKIIFIPNWRI